MIKLTQKLSPKTFVYSQILILVFSLMFLGGLHYIVNVQFVKSGKYFARGPVTSAPKVVALEVTSPDDQSVVFDATTLVSGKSLPKATVLISSKDSEGIVQAETDGTFAVSFPLVEGLNEITVTAFDQKGEERLTIRSVYYSKEKL